MTNTTHDLSATVEAAAQALPVERQEKFVTTVAALLASHPATPTQRQIELVIRLARMNAD